MLTSGTVGANKKQAIETYRRLLAKKYGSKIAANAVVNSTATMSWLKRIWKLEEIYNEAR